MDVVDVVRKWFVCVWFVTPGQPEQIKAWECFGTRNEARACYRSLREVNFEGELGIKPRVTYNHVMAKCPSVAENVSLRRREKWLRLRHMEDWLKNS